MKHFIDLLFSFNTICFLALLFPGDVLAQDQAKKKMDIFISSGIGYSKNFSEITNLESAINYSAQSPPLRGVAFGLGVDLVRSNLELSFGLDAYRLGDYLEVSVRGDGYDGSVFMSNYKMNYFVSGFLGYKIKILFFNVVPSIGVLYSANAKMENSGGLGTYYVENDTITFGKRMNSVNPSPFVFGANLRLECPIKVRQWKFYISYEFLIASAMSPVYKTEGILLKNGITQLTVQSQNLSRLTVHNLRLAFLISH